MCSSTETNINWDHLYRLHCSIHMLFYSLLFLLSSNLLFCTCHDRGFNSSNCSLSFTVGTAFPSNKIPTDFPIELIAKYNLPWAVPDLAAYYKITPLAALPFRRHKNEGDSDHRICRQIHIGINNLYVFWNFPMKFVYIFLLGAMGSYYIILFLRGKWRKSGKRRKNGKKAKAAAMKTPSPLETKRDTFENEKVRGEETSDEE